MEAQNTNTPATNVVAANAAAEILKEAARQDKTGEATSPVVKQIAANAGVPATAVQQTVQRLANEAVAANKKIAAPRILEDVSKKPGATPATNKKQAIPAPVVKRASRLGDLPQKVLEALKKSTKGVGLTVAEMAKDFKVGERDIRLAIDKNRLIASKTGAPKIERLKLNTFGYPKVAPAKAK